ncbi:hypothetical protein N7474_001331 [Penicillium riverlandense]|uniref:uncharacterized protein n=1 Tax=Penicillium riverlandense TaxID=1903569 RepID=UPI002549BF54|nr:uncharacterized protein N7474_001331 [Penicillium riverlandense]KAJ5833020.1 hypothetical protein N7474_001331 [Penicillium riverlandense]
MSTRLLRLGILGASDAVPTTYLPVLHTLQKQYHLTIIYDPNSHHAEACKAKFNIAQTTTDIQEVLHHPDVDLILNLLPTEYHEKYTVAALEAGKHVMVEVPLCMSIHGLRRIRDAIKKGQAVRTHGEGDGDGGNVGKPKIFMGCVRRYAPVVEDVFKKELASLGRVYYARCRNIAGPMNIVASVLNGTSDTNGNNGTDETSTHSTAEFHSTLSEMFGLPEDLTPDRVAFCRWLGTLGCHDLSLMRETLGFPNAVSSVSITDPFYSAIFHYTDTRHDGHPFTLLYEAGVDTVPRCDAHLTVYGERRSVSLQYDFPCPGESIGQGRAVRVVVEESVDGDGDEAVNGNGNGCANVTGAGVSNGSTSTGAARPRVKRTETVSSCEEAYASEFTALHAYLVDDVPAKTSADDALLDLRMLYMIFDHYDRQCGTIRTPLG